MQHWKYILFCTAMHGETIVLFPPHITHADMCSAFPRDKVISAGFLNFNEETKRFICYGKSTSLGVESRPEEDEFFANKLVAPSF